MPERSISSTFCSRSVIRGGRLCCCSERHGDRGAADRVRFFNHLVKKSLVADVNPVEIADRDHRAFKGLSYLVQLVDEQHTYPFPKRTIHLT
jgi:hypothetical protein